MQKNAEKTAKTASTSLALLAVIAMIISACAPQPTHRTWTGAAHDCAIDVAGRHVPKDDQIVTLVEDIGHDVDSVTVGTDTADVAPVQFKGTDEAETIYDSAFHVACDGNDDRCDGLLEFRLVFRVYSADGIDPRSGTYDDENNQHCTVDMLPGHEDR